MLGELADNKYGIAYTGMQYGRRFPQIKAIALSAQECGLYVEPTKENFQNRTYPLARSVFIYLNRPPGNCLDSKLSEFLHYILSREGQEDVARSGAYLPLTADGAHKQLEKLNERLFHSRARVDGRSETNEDFVPTRNPQGIVSCQSNELGWLRFCNTVAGFWGEARCSRILAMPFVLC